MVVMDPPEGAEYMKFVKGKTFLIKLSSNERGDAPEDVGEVGAL